LKAVAPSDHDRALRRLDAALVEENRLGRRLGAAVGASTKFGIYVRLRDAADQVRARKAWVNWIDDKGYRGLNAGPFELLAESRENSLRKRTGKVRSLTPTERPYTATPDAPRRDEMNRADVQRRVDQIIKYMRQPGSRQGGAEDG
jgi:hypothetical protein